MVRGTNGAGVIAALLVYAGVVTVGLLLAVRVEELRIAQRDRLLEKTTQELREGARLLNQAKSLIRQERMLEEIAP